MFSRWIKFIFVLAFLLHTKSFTQELMPEHGPWTFLFQKDSVTAYFIWYAKADNKNDGVVVKLVNLNNFKVNYKFDLIFLSDTLKHIIKVEGILKPNETKTGSSQGLFWVPFKNGNSISDVGIHGFTIVPNSKVSQPQ
ncbi:MAG: hypothetical protein M1480_14865 [Bacteroidetes bacterium]|nr:hypothetical protein [Bacteroidota bacterium]